MGSTPFEGTMRLHSLIKLTDEYREILTKELPNVRKPEFYEQFMANESFVYIGEVVQMPGHIICAGVQDGKVYVGFHDDDFVELTDDEA